MKRLAIILIIILLIGGYIMADTTGLFKSTDGSPSYSEAQVAKMNNSMVDGIVPNYENELKTTLSGGLVVQTDTGYLWSKGYWFYRDTADTVTVDAASAGNNRIDRIVVEFDTVNQTAEIKISKGTETTGTPTAPALVDTATVWEVHLAYVDITASTVNSVDDSDRVIFGARVARQPFCQVERGSGNQTSGTDLEFQTAPKDEWSMWNATNPERITFPEDGDYLVCWYFGFTQNVTTSGAATANVKINGSGEILSRVQLISVNAVWRGSQTFEVSKDDYISWSSPLTLDASNYLRSLEVYVTVKKIN